MPLKINLGVASLQGPRERNEDFIGAVTPEGDQLATKGVVVALADGVSGNGGGREAAENTVRGLLSDYYATPDTWGISHALDKVITALNRWLLAQSTSHRELSGMACTLSVLVLRGTRFTLAHVGDSRIYRLRGEHMEQLTTDHVWDRPDMNHVLTRAVGLDQHLAMDYAEGDLQPGDVFLLVCDGVWEPLGDKAMHHILHLRQDPQRAAQALVQEALDTGGRDNASAMVVRIEELSAGTLGDVLAEGRRLPLPPSLKPGQRIDDFEVLELLHDSRATLLYKVRHVESGQIRVLKTLQPLLARDEEACTAFLGEEWVGKRVLAHYFPQVIPLSTGQRHYLYYIMTWHEGATLGQMLERGQHFSIAEATGIGIRVAKGLGALHRLDIVHRDIKPENLHLGADGKLRILDLGVASSGGAGQSDGRGPGTPSFMAPELFNGVAATAQADLYAAGVSLYYLLTRKYPYGEIEPFQTPRFKEPTPPTRYRPDIPQWLENILLKAVARDPKRRFETAEELLVALERGEARPLLSPQREALAERDPLMVWQTVAISAILFNLLLIYLLFAT